MEIEHIALYVKNIEKAKSFFIQHLGGTAHAIYRNKKTNFQSYFIDEAHLEIMNRPDL